MHSTCAHTHRFTTHMRTPTLNLFLFLVFLCHSSHQKLMEKHDAATKRKKKKQFVKSWPTCFSKSFLPGRKLHVEVNVFVLHFDVMPIFIHSFIHFSRYRQTVQKKQNKNRKSKLFYNILLQMYSHSHHDFIKRQVKYKF